MTMPTTRQQTAIAEGKIKVDKQHASSMTPWKRMHSSKYMNHNESGGDSEMKEGGQVLTRKQGKKCETKQAGGGFNDENKTPLSKKSRFRTDNQHYFKPGLLFRPHVKPETDNSHPRDN